MTMASGNRLNRGIAAATQFNQGIGADFFEGDVFDGITISHTGRQGLLPMAVDLLAVSGRFGENQVAQAVEEASHPGGSCVHGFVLSSRFMVGLPA